MSTELVGECWLQSARVARKAGHHQTAFNALLNAENTHLAELVTEKAKWLWSKVKPTCRLGQTVYCFVSSFLIQLKYDFQPYSHTKTTPLCQSDFRATCTRP